MKNNYPNWIDGYGKAVYEITASHDVATNLPFDGFELMPLYADLWIDHLYLAIKKFRESNITIDEISKVLPNHSSMKFNLFELAFMFQSAKSDYKIVREITDFFVEIIKYRSVSKLWWENNIIKEYSNVVGVVESKKLLKVETETAKSVAKLSAGCAMLTQGLYNDFVTDYGYDVFGPYNAKDVYGEDYSLWIKEFADLNPVEIWPDRKDFPYKRITIFNVYKDLDSESYYIGCHMNYKQNLIDQMSYFQVEIDGSFVNNLEELNEVRDVILKNASEHFLLYKQFDFEKQKEIWMWQMCYQFKNFFEFLKLDWGPTKELLDSVKNKSLIPYYSKSDFNFSWHAETYGTNYLRDAYNLKK